MGLILILILIALALLAILILFRNAKKEESARPAKGPREGNGGTPRAASQGSRDSTRSSPVQHPGPDYSGVPVLDPAIPDLSRELKIRLREGVDFIFSVNPAAMPQGSRNPQPEDLDPQVVQAVREQIRNLKNFRVTHDLCRALDNPNSNMSDLAKIIVTDPILSGKILKVANSAYFGLAQKVNSIGQALMIIGLYHIKNMLYRDGLTPFFAGKTPAASQEFERLWEHAVLTSICAGYVQDLFPGLDKGTVFTLGLLHDIGKFILPNLPSRRPETRAGEEAPIPTRSLQDEEEEFGLNHALIGRLAFEEWQFSELMKSVVDLHHTPQFLEIEALRLDGERLKYLLVLFLADQTAKLLSREGRETQPVATLASSYHVIVHPDRLAGLVLDNALLSEVRKSRAVLESYLGRS